MKNMTVRELISELEKVQDKDLPVACYSKAGDLETCPIVTDDGVCRYLFNREKSMWETIKVITIEG